jgi:hypothetical protein
MATPPFPYDYALLCYDGNCSGGAADVSFEGDNLDWDVWAWVQNGR